MINNGEISKTIVNPVDNINKITQSFQEIGPVQKEILPLYNLPDHAYE